MSTIAETIGTVGSSSDRGAAGLLRVIARTDGNVAGAVARLTLAVVMFPHGAQKLLGWFGGYGFEGTMGYLTGSVGLPALIALLVIVIEFFGPIALALGFLGRIAAVGVAAVMIGAVATSHLAFGFFMNWSGAQGGEGFEYHLLALALTAIVLVNGSGPLSLDRRIAGEEVV
jgi:putative oxidoreductase